MSDHKPSKADTCPSYGAIVLREDKVLMIRSAKSWSFPKGHQEPGELPLDTALRELREETNIIATPDGDFAWTVPSARKEDRRTVTFFRMRYVSGEIVVQTSETPEAAWVPVDEAGERIAFLPDREALEQALKR